jgi:hypothetical protein
MSSLLHPVGPEPAKTYWVRRAVVVGALAVLIAIVVVLITQGSSSGGAQGPLAVPQTPSAAASTGASAGSAGSAEPSASAPSSAASSRRSAKPSASTSSNAPAEAVICDPGQLRVTLNGSGRVKPKQSNTFTLSLINGGPQTCLAKVSNDDFDLTIYSGKDRIWSSRDCSSVLQNVQQKVKSEQAVQWQMKWNGLRSAKNCKTRAQVPKTGTYIVRAHLSGAKSVQFRMLLRN